MGRRDGYFRASLGSDCSRCRNYPLKKIAENNEAEIMEVIAQEACDSYEPEIVVELTSESVEDLVSNVARVVEWIDAWKKDHPDGG